MVVLKDLIKIIPDILQYFVSGYIFISIFCWIASKKINLTVLLIWSAIISFTLTSFIKAINISFIKLNFLNNIWGISFLSIVLSIILAFIIGKRFRSKKFADKMVGKFGISPYDSIWENIITHKSAYLKIYLKDKNYYFQGSFYSIEDKDDKSWICIKQHQKCNMKDEVIYSQENTTNVNLVLKLSDVDYIELWDGDSDNNFN